jgi:hypothetical protein
MQVSNDVSFQDTLRAVGSASFQPQNLLYCASLLSTELYGLLMGVAGKSFPPLPSLSFEEVIKLRSRNCL